MAVTKSTGVQQSSWHPELYIPAGAICKGNMETSGDVRIDGFLEGDVISREGDAYLGAAAMVIGNVFGNDVAIAGVVRGDIRTGGQLSVFSGAKIAGNIMANALLLEHNAEYEGYVLIRPERSNVTAIIREGSTPQDNQSVQRVLQAAPQAHTRKRVNPVPVQNTTADEAAVKRPKKAQPADIAGPAPHKLPPEEVE